MSTTEQCQERNMSLTHDITCILSYEGSEKDIVINYALLAFNLAVAAAIVVRSQSLTAYATSLSRKRYSVPACLASLVFVILFQIVLCLAVKCAGVSIIWCAVGGWILMDRQRQSNEMLHETFPFRVLVLLVDQVVVSYYAITMEPITTVAHLLAVVVLGIPLHFLCTKDCGQNCHNHDDAITSQPLVDGLHENSTRMQHGDAQSIGVQQLKNKS